MNTACYETNEALGVLENKEFDEDALSTGQVSKNNKTVQLVNSESVEYFSFHSGILCPIKKAIVEKIPYLSVLIATSIPTKKDAAGATILPPEARLENMRPIIAYLESDDEAALLKKLSCKENLFEFIQLVDFFGCYLPKNYDSVDSILNGLKNTDGKSQMKIARHCYEDIPSTRHIGRASGVKFIFWLNSDNCNATINNNPRRRNQIFMAIENIFSHTRTFGKRIRHHLKTIYETKLKQYATVKQKANIAKWLVDRNPVGDDESASDCSTDEYEYDGYSS